MDTEFLLVKLWNWPINRTWKRLEYDTKINLRNRFWLFGLEWTSPGLCPFALICCWTFWFCYPRVSSVSHPGQQLIIAIYSGRPLCMIVSVLYRHIQRYLNNVLENMANKRGVASVSTLTSDIHVWPDFHGNRSPLADPSLLGMVILFQFILYIIKIWSSLLTEGFDVWSYCFHTKGTWFRNLVLDAYTVNTTMEQNLPNFLALIITRLKCKS